MIASTVCTRITSRARLQLQALPMRTQEGICDVRVLELSQTGVEPKRPLAISSNWACTRRHYIPSTMHSSRMQNCGPAAAGRCRVTP